MNSRTIETYPKAGKKGAKPGAETEKPSGSGGLRLIGIFREEMTGKPALRSGGRKGREMGAPDSRRQGASLYSYKKGG